MLRVLSAKPHLLLLEAPMAIGNQRTGRLTGGALLQKPKLLDQVRDTVRRKHYSIRTEATMLIGSSMRSQGDALDQYISRR